jgi:NitT/TauT family transport system permease protein
MTDAARNVPRSVIKTAQAPLRQAAWSRESIERLMNIISPVFLIGLWELAAQTGLIDVRFFPPPSKIFGVMFTMIKSGVLEMHVWASLQRLFWGLLWGGVPALVLGVAMGLYRNLRIIVEPVISATYPIPKSAILPLILLIFGLGEASRSSWSQSACSFRS